MRARYHAVLGWAALAAVSTAAFSTDVLATACSASTAAVYSTSAGVGTSGSCRTNSQTINVLIENSATASIYNLVDNSINFLQANSTASATISTFIESTPTTTIYNLVDNSINLQVSGTINAPISIFIENLSTTIIFNLVDNAINFLQTIGSAGTAISTFIESTPTTAIYNIVDNSINVALTGANVQDDPASSAVAAVAEPASLPLLGLALGALGLIHITRHTPWARHRNWAGSCFP